MSNWPPAGNAPAFDDGDVHVWRVALDGERALSADRWALLSPDEHGRADRFRMARDRHRYVRARGALRTILGTYLNAAPTDLRFDYGPHGKPGLSSSFAPLSFNVSHSEDLALIAVRRGGPLGVDVECVRGDGGLEIAERFFCPAERAWLLALPREQRPEGFFIVWTRKEAYIKARGSGLWHDLAGFDVSQAPSRPVRHTNADGQTGPWFVQDLAPGPGYAAALAVEGGAGRVRTRDFGEAAPD